MQIKRSERQERANDKALAAIELIKKAVSDAGGDMSVLNNLGAIFKCSEYQAQCRLARYIVYLCDDVSKKYLIGEVANFSMKVHKAGPYTYVVKNSREEWNFAIEKLLELLGLSDNIIKRAQQTGLVTERIFVTFVSKRLPDEVRHQLQLIYNKTFEARVESVKEIHLIQKQIADLENKLKVVETSLENIDFLLDNEEALLQEATKSYLR